MKTEFINIPIAIFITILTINTLTACASPEQSTPSKPLILATTEPSTTHCAMLIGAKKAKSIAVADADAAVTDIVLIKNNYEAEDMVYDISFIVGDTEYDYEIDAINGSILSTEREKNASSAESTYIGIDAAKSIALSHAGINNNAPVFTKAKMEDDDGGAEYELEFCIGNTEYEYSINASDGRIIEFDSEIND